MASLADPSDATAPDPVASACLRLGWRIEELFSQLDVPEGPQRSYGLASLPGLSDLTSYDKQRLGLDEVDFVIGQVAHAVSHPHDVPLKLTRDARRALAATILGADDGAASRREEYRAALAALHVDILVTLTAADSGYGKAYGLGRALADTTRPHQTPGQLTSAFESHRIGQLDEWLDELASLLPSHAARAVAQSLDWWQQAVTAAAIGSKLSTAAMPANFHGNAGRPLSRWKQAAAAVSPPGMRSRISQVDPPPLEHLASAVAQQGALWRGVLEGDKACTDLLSAEDYVRAADRFALNFAGMIGRALRTMPWLVLVLLLVLAAIVLVLIFIPGSAVARTATAIAAVAGTFSGIWALARANLAPIAEQLAKPLWGAELNAATAEAVTVPPVGPARAPVWDTAAERVGVDSASAAAQVQAAPSP